AALAEEQGQLALPDRVLVGAARDQQLPAPPRRLLGAARGRGVEGVRPVLDNEAEHAEALASPERPCDVVAAEAEALDRLAHTRGRLRCDAALAVDDARDGLEADAGGGRDVGHCRSVDRAHTATPTPPVIIPTPASSGGSLGVRVGIVRPSRSTVIRSATANTSGRLWLIMTIERPWLRTS